MIEETREQLISKLKTTQKQLSALLESVAEDQDWQPDPGQWSFRYIAAHLATVEKDCYQDRVLRIAAGEKPHFESYFNTGRDFGQFDLRDSVREWAVTRGEIIDFVRALPEESWSLFGTHAAFGTITLLDVLEMMLGHDQEHLQHLRQVMNEYGTKTQNIPIAPSPIFGLIVLITGIAGCLAYLGKFPSATVFVFVTGGWITSLCLHEFGHALVAWLGGDKGVADKGYLTLNPIRYTHSLFSIIFPLVFLVMGGIGLPGGAVYINSSAIRSRRMRSLTSAAGPIATGTVAIVLLVPFAVGLVNLDLVVGAHFPFWAGLALLAFLQLTGLFFNLLPIPGLDGFGILEPYLSQGVSRSIRNLGYFTYIIIFLLFFNNTPVSRGFWNLIAFISSLVGLDYDLVYFGFSIFQFWR